MDDGKCPENQNKIGKYLDWPYKGHICTLQCIDPGDRSETAYLPMTTSGGTRMQSQKQKRMVQGAEDPGQEHQFSWDYGCILLPWNEWWPYRLRSQWHYPGPSRHICCVRRSFPSLFLYCFTLCIDALICWQGLCMTIRGTNLDTHHQTIIPISSLSSLCLIRITLPTMYRMLTGLSKYSRPFQVQQFQYK